MLNLVKAVRRTGANPLRWGLGSYQAGMIFLQPAELHHQAVVLAVANLGVVQHVVAIVVMVDLFT